MPPILSRREVSRLVRPERADELEALVSTRLQLVRYGGEATTRSRTVYLDDRDRTLSARILARPRRSTKIRLRSYHNATGTWVEVKTRDGEDVEKNRYFMEGDPLETLRQTVLLEPVAVVEYERRAYQLGDSGLRVTFDRNLLVGDISPAGKSVNMVPLANGCVVEIKATDGTNIPRWLDGVVRSAATDSYSKSVAAFSARREHLAA